MLFNKARDEFRIHGFHLQMRQFLDEQGRTRVYDPGVAVR